jgi:hypothetical protein
MPILLTQNETLNKVRCRLVLHLYLLAIIRMEKHQAVISYVRGT